MSSGSRTAPSRLYQRFAGAADTKALRQQINAKIKLLALSLDDFRAKLHRAAVELNEDPPSDLLIQGWWDQARTLEDE